MNKFFKTISLIILVVLAVVVLGTQVVRALRDAAAPPALPYGLTMQDTMAAVEHRLGQPRVVYAPQAGWEPGLPDEGGSPGSFSLLGCLQTLWSDHCLQHTFCEGQERNDPFFSRQLMRTRSNAY
ncbi:MAG TPA: hypothetical protein VMN99_16005 [Anaerolineales bacterium]|nr:hypothetical protein [Anaerolineales bacterium]